MTLKEGIVVELEAAMYTTEYYEVLQEDSRCSASAVVPLLIELFRPQSVLDVGCGTAEWLAVFQEHGIADVAGVDGPYVDRTMLQIAEERFVPHDLKEPLFLGRKFDLCLSLEVAEHLPEDRAETFVQSLVTAAPVVVFSAAIPHQGGELHMNEQWPEYWAYLFERYHYVPVDCLRKRIWYDESVGPWYRQNLLVFIHEHELPHFPAVHADVNRAPHTMLSVIHPYFYLRYNGGS